MQNREAEILDGFAESRGLSFVRDRRKEEVCRLQRKAGIPVLTFPNLEEQDWLEHLFTTRAGGVSEGMFSTMNFSVNLGDSPENVRENYCRTAKALKCSYEDLTGTKQTHTTNIVRVEEKDRGRGISKLPGYEDVDALITNVPGIALAAYTADCVPIYFADPVKKAIGLAHSGWRGTAGNMAGKMVQAMETEFGTFPGDVIAAIGPSICPDCYEVDQQVADHFQSLLGNCDEELEKLHRFGNYPVRNEQGYRGYLEDGKEAGKYQLNLWLVNLILLVRAGVKPANIAVTDLCTAHNKNLLFSHRASMGKRGNMGAFLMIRRR